MQTLLSCVLSEYAIKKTCSVIIVTKIQQKPLTEEHLTSKEMISINGDRCGQVSKTPTSY